MVSAIGSIIGGGLSLLGASKQANAAKDASYLQAEASQSDRELQKYMYDTTRSDQMPWITAGSAAIGKMADLAGTSGNTSAAGYGSLTKPFSLSDFQADPGYQFNLSEGQKALDRTSLAKGKYFSGEASKALNRYSQDYASNEFNNAYNRYNTNQTNTWNRLASLSGAGQTSANTLSGANQNYATSAGNAINNQAAANASGIVGSANAWNSGLTNAASSLGSLFNSLGATTGMSGGYDPMTGITWNSGRYYG